MGVDIVTLTVRWQGRFCGRRGTEGQPVAGGCDFHCTDGTDLDLAFGGRQVCCRFGKGTTIGSGNLLDLDPIPLDSGPEGAVLRCTECIEEYGEE